MVSSIYAQVISGRTTLEKDIFVGLFLSVVCTLFVIIVFFILFYFFYDGEPRQGRALQTHPCKVNLGPMHLTVGSFPT